jgi:hypothetical protein
MRCSDLGAGRASVRSESAAGPEHCDNDDRPEPSAIDNLADLYHPEADHDEILPCALATVDETFDDLAGRTILTALALLRDVSVFRALIVVPSARVPTRIVFGVWRPLIA